MPDVDILILSSADEEKLFDNAPANFSSL